MALAFFFPFFGYFTPVWSADLTSHNWEGKNALIDVVRDYEYTPIFEMRERISEYVPVFDAPVHKNKIFARSSVTCVLLGEVFRKLGEDAASVYHETSRRRELRLSRFWTFGAVSKR